MMFAALFLALAGAQRPATSPPIVVRLEPQIPTKERALNWSPKGAKVLMTRKGFFLTASFALGPSGTKPVDLRLSRTSSARHPDVMEIDLDHNGKFSAKEKFTCEPTETRKKWWSSFEATVTIPVPDEIPAKPAKQRAYPLSIWYVEDPAEPNAEPELHWSRSGWHQGTLEIGGKPAFVLITEMEMDGVFDKRDAWAINRDADLLLKSPITTLDGHVWLEGVAYRATAIDPHGRSITFESYDPGTTEAEELAKSDVYAPDRNAPRAAKPVVFGRDLAVALADAKRDNKRVLVDFETTWCGPCQMMDQFVYTSAPVADALANVIAVKLDGDDQHELAKSYNVTGYPTILVFDADGKEVKRVVGYQSVKALVEFLK